MILVWHTLRMVLNLCLILILQKAKLVKQIKRRYYIIVYVGRFWPPNFGPNFRPISASYHKKPVFYSDILLPPFNVGCICLWPWRSIVRCVNEEGEGGVMRVEKNCSQMCA